MSSIFTKIINREIPAYILHENKNFISILDINPLTHGHSLVIPKVETDYFFELDDIYLSKIMVFSKVVSNALSKSVSCERVGLSIVGLEVPHAHVHLIPFNNEKEMSFSNERLNFSEDQFLELQKKIIKNLN
ncbi:MAG: HIT family protein [Cytophagales bacterium]|jgi:histidine triad (HIT) family protein|nr:MAG: HIT family protein [Rhodothermaeota bacterium MED-G19]|tara:strand:+ start:384 stop:779 length:396 start_codon:yes stop_codon:yes gene_type:complete